MYMKLLVLSDGPKTLQQLATLHWSTGGTLMIILFSSWRVPLSGIHVEVPVGVPCHLFCLREIFARVGGEGWVRKLVMESAENGLRLN